MDNFILYFLGIIFGIYFIHIQEEWFFKCINEHYCKQYNGNCEKCKCWSCERYKILQDLKKEIN